MTPREGVQDAGGTGRKMVIEVKVEVLPVQGISILIGTQRSVYDPYMDADTDWGICAAPSV